MKARATAIMTALVLLPLALAPHAGAQEAVECVGVLEQAYFSDDDLGPPTFHDRVNVWLWVDQSPAVYLFVGNLRVGDEGYEGSLTWAGCGETVDCIIDAITGRVDPNAPVPVGHCFKKQA